MSKAKLGGILLIVSAIGGLISISLFYIISAVLIGIAGLMGVFKKDKPQNASEEKVIL
ncbi:hypothetical protein ACFQ3N_19080 [Virgibacillus byunsanensis]|uniref:DUF2273 domain-containing protein n=1 Tax=Virgibacillus byunsanensis TaxID=570945 RepID=A0ABW3LT04_9BACI